MSNPSQKETFKGSQTDKVVSRHPDLSNMDQSANDESKSSSNINESSEIMDHDSPSNSTFIVSSNQSNLQEAMGNPSDGESAIGDPDFNMTYTPAIDSEADNQEKKTSPVNTPGLDSSRLLSQFEQELGISNEHEVTIVPAPLTSTQQVSPPVVNPAQSRVSEKDIDALLHSAARTPLPTSPLRPNEQVIRDLWLETDQVNGLKQPRETPNNKLPPSHPSNLNAVRSQKRPKMSPLGAIPKYGPKKACFNDSPSTKERQDVPANPQQDEERNDQSIKDGATPSPMVSSNETPPNPNSEQQSTARAESYCQGEENETVVAPPKSKSHFIDLSAAIVEVRKHKPTQKGQVEVFGPTDPNVVVVNMDFVSRETLEQKNQDSALDTLETSNKSQIIPIEEIMDSARLVGNNQSSIRSQGILQYVLLACIRGQKEWKIPPLETFFDVMGMVECELIAQNSPFLSALKWSSPWGKIGLIGLATKNLEKLQGFRNFLAKFHIHNFDFITVPRDLLDPKNIVTILLRENHRTFRADLIPVALLQRNNILKGRLRTLRVRHYNPDEISSNGASKRGWRTVVLEGDIDFMDSLAKTEDDHKFTLGAGFIYIKGGERKESTTSNSQTNTRDPRSVLSGENGLPIDGQRGGRQYRNDGKRNTQDRERSTQNQGNRRPRQLNRRESRSLSGSQRRRWGREGDYPQRKGSSSRPQTYQGQEANKRDEQNQNQEENQYE